MKTYVESDRTGSNIIVYISREELKGVVSDTIQKKLNKSYNLSVKYVSTFNQPPFKSAAGSWLQERNSEDL